MDAPKPWTLLRERSRRDYRIFTTRTLDVSDPRTGTEYIRTVIDAPDWANVVPITTRDELVLVRQFRFGTWSNHLEIPGGMVDPGEAPLAAAGRELEEETGYRPAALVAIGVSHPNPAIQGNRLHSFLATGCELSGAPPRQDSSEDLRVELVPRAQLKRLVLEGQITHSLVLATLLFETWRTP